MHSIKWERQRHWWKRHSRRMAWREENWIQPPLWVANKLLSGLPSTPPHTCRCVGACRSRSRDTHGFLHSWSLRGPEKNLLSLNNMALNYHQQRALVKGFAGGKHSIGNHQIQTEKKNLNYTFNNVFGSGYAIEIEGRLSWMRINFEQTFDFSSPNVNHSCQIPCQIVFKLIHLIRHSLTFVREKNHIWNDYVQVLASI